MDTPVLDLHNSPYILSLHPIIANYKKLKNRKADRTVGLNCIYIFQYFVRHGLTSLGNEQLKKKRYNLNNQDNR